MESKRFLNTLPLVAFAVGAMALTVLLAACATQSAALLDTEWSLISLNGGALIEDTEITLNFREASLDGSAGCNTYGGSYTASEDSLRLNGVYATEMGCMEPKGILEQETAYLDALNAAARYRVDDDRLEVYDEAGAQILAFVAAVGPSSVRATPTPAINGDVPQDPPVAARMVPVESIEILILESFPVQVHVLVKGSLPDGCTEIDQINQRSDLENNIFWVEITTVRPTNVECTTKVVPFEDTIPLDVYGLPAGAYTVDVNGVSGTFTLDVGNVLSEGAADDAPEGALSVSELL